MLKKAWVAAGAGADQPVEPAVAAPGVTRHALRPESLRPGRARCPRSRRELAGARRIGQ